MKSYKFLFYVFFIVTTSCGWREKRFDGDYQSPQTYDLNQPVKMVLPQLLDEISGLTIGENGHIWAIQDEASVVYELKWPDNKILRKSKFAKNMDTEDILFTQKGLFALKSNGDIYEVTDIFTDKANSLKHDFPFEGKRDLESLAQFDENTLLLYCKECKLDKDDNVASGFFFDLGSKQFREAKGFKLTEKKMRKLLTEKDTFKLTVKPSAIALHPIEKKLYVLSSVGKWLLIKDRFGDMEKLYRLNPRVFKQAEGICFSNNGDMFISNEAQDGNANILMFAYKP
ncbi:hypothetical protein GCM10028791_38210 [Echinicola sediminis]